MNILSAESFDVSISSDADSERSDKSVDQKIKELVLVYFIVRLALLFGHTQPSGLLQLTSFERHPFAVAVVSTEPL
jgi:hypothetical protein